jgi:hypothetical protein
MDNDENKPMNRNEFEAQIIAKVWKDAQFRARFLADPKGVMQTELSAVYPNAKLPEDLKINVVEETDKELTIVVPQNPAALTDKAMSDEELDAVAGGTIAVVVAVALTVAVTINTAAQTNVGANINVGANVNIGYNVSIASNQTTTS